MKKYPNYKDLVSICQEINEKYIPHEDVFYHKMDEILDTSPLEGSDLLLFSFQELLKTVDREIEKIEKQVKITPVCNKGCSYCCYFPIIVTKFEGKLIRRMIKKRPETEKKEIENHLNHYFKKYEDVMQTIGMKNDDKVTDFKLQYIKKQLPCPFLQTEEKKCMIYSIRPIPCRTYLNYCHPDVCKEEYMPKEPFSYEFLREHYIGALYELVQTLLYEEEMEEDFCFPDDFFEVDHLANMF